MSFSVEGSPNFFRGLDLADVAPEQQNLIPVTYLAEEEEEEEWVEMDDLTQQDRQLHSCVAPPRRPW